DSGPRVAPGPAPRVVRWGHAWEGAMAAPMPGNPYALTGEDWRVFETLLAMHPPAEPNIVLHVAKAIGAHRDAPDGWTARLLLHLAWAGLWSQASTAGPERGAPMESLQPHLEQLRRASRERHDEGAEEEIGFLVGLGIDYYLRLHYGIMQPMADGPTPN